MWFRWPKAEMTQPTPDAFGISWQPAVCTGPCELRVLCSLCKYFCLIPNVVFAVQQWQTRVDVSSDIVQTYFAPWLHFTIVKTQSTAMRKLLNEPERHLKLLVLFFNFSFIFIDGGTADNLNCQVVFVWFGFRFFLIWEIVLMTQWCGCTKV